MTSSRSLQTENKPFIGMVALVQKQMSVLKSVYSNCYLRFSLHVEDSKDIYLAIVSTILIFLIAFFALIHNQHVFHCFRYLQPQHAFSLKTTLNTDKSKQLLLQQQQEEDEQFYNSYTFK